MEVRTQPSGLWPTGMRNNKDIPTLVKELRARLHLTQEQFAQKVGVTYSTVNHWENGKRIPQPFLLKRLQDMEASLQPKPESQKKRGRRPKRGISG